LGHGPCLLRIISFGAAEPHGCLMLADSVGWIRCGSCRASASGRFDVITCSGVGAHRDGDHKFLAVHLLQVQWPATLTKSRFSLRALLPGKFGYSVPKLPKGRGCCWRPHALHTGFHVLARAQARKRLCGHHAAFCIRCIPPLCAEKYCEVRAIAAGLLTGVDSTSLCWLCCTPTPPSFM